MNALALPLLALIGSASAASWSNMNRYKQQPTNCWRAPMCDGGYCWNTFENVKTWCANSKTCNLILTYGGGNNHQYTFYCPDLNAVTWKANSHPDLWGYGNSNAYKCTSGCGTGIPEVGRRKTVVQSTYYHGGAATNNGVYSDLAHTHTEKNPWILIDLGSRHYIDNARIFNRRDSPCGGRMMTYGDACDGFGDTTTTYSSSGQGAEVGVSDRLPSGDTFPGFQLCERKVKFTRNNLYNFNCNGKSGRYVIYRQLGNSRMINFHEMEVYGTPVTKSPTTKSPTKSPTTKSPTKKPTKRPTTKSPTTKSPTKKPTKSPTTKSPTKRPTTKSPTLSPTVAAVSNLQKNIDDWCESQSACDNKMCVARKDLGNSEQRTAEWRCYNTLELDWSATGSNNCVDNCGHLIACKGAVSGQSNSHHSLIGGIESAINNYKHTTCDTASPTQSPTTEAQLKAQQHSAALQAHPWQTAQIGQNIYKNNDFQGTYVNTPDQRGAWILIDRAEVASAFSGNSEFETEDGDWTIDPDGGITFHSKVLDTIFTFPWECACTA